MSEINITIPAGTTKRLLTAGKYCPDDILVTAEGGSGSRLPDGYTELEYIQSSGTQYIDSGLKGSQNTRIDADYYTTATAGAIIGADTKWGSNMFTVEVHFAAFATSNYHHTSVPSGRHTVSLNKGVLSLDGTTLSTMSGTFATPVNMTLFALNRNGAVQEYGSIRLYSMQIYESDVLVRDYVPCINDSGEVGLYDLVGRKFYGNAGTGIFSKPSALPTLTNPAAAENIEAGFEAIDGTGAILVGSLVKGFTKFERVVTNERLTDLCTLDSACVYICSMWRPSTNYYALCLIENNAITWEQHGASATQFKIVNGVLQSTSSISYSTVWKISK